MAKTLGFMANRASALTDADLHRFDGAARIQDPVAFAATLDALIREKLAAMEQAAAPAALLQERAQALRAPVRWLPSATDIQRGRLALLDAFERPGNLPLADFARLARVSRQQVYKDIARTPPRLLALRAGPRQQRLPDWQLDPLRRRLTQQVLQRAAGVDAWTVYTALSEPMEALQGQAAVDVVTAANIDRVTAAVCAALGLH